MLAPFLKDHLDSALARRRRVRSFADQVRHLLLGSRVPVPATTAKTAGFLGVSPATLHRRLRSEGTSFSRLLEEVNYQLARQYLLNSTLTVTQISHILGYSETASFTRAFSRWSDGQTPSLFRRTAAQSK